MFNNQHQAEDIRCERKIGQSCNSVSDMTEFLLNLKGGNAVGILSWNS